MISFRRVFSVFKIEENFIIIVLISHIYQETSNALGWFSENLTIAFANN